MNNTTQSHLSLYNYCKISLFKCLCILYITVRDADKYLQFK